MPTQRRRHAITETDDVASALEAAKQRWPELAGRPSELLRQLIREGHKAIAADRGRDARIAAIKKTKGALTGVYGPDYLKELRADWPA
ncbi:MAG: hypothetical protein ACM4D3_16305 [Candidatus Sericytochromatia bacterium]